MALRSTSPDPNSVVKNSSRSSKHLLIRRVAATLEAEPVQNWQFEAETRKRSWSE
ncbi:hypothetical protein COLO4_32243 [Corchorus olitorius]|uniref:Uncharacterized protein n=1 Tax=Corchorus olitorius TaxID=93759 RepID=A0A1R3H0A1_9ROSI|nr:hypothetical protein COLO4_32243 [Corchorus olitorius]